MNAPEDFEEYDLTLVREHYAQQKTLSRASFAFKAGAGALLAGAGIGLAAYGISFAIEPKVITTERTIVTEKVVEVDKPIITERVVTVDKPIITECVIQAPAPAPLPLPAEPLETGRRMTPQEFQNSSTYQDAPKCRGRLISHIAGQMKFADGSVCKDALPSGEIDTRLTTTENDNEQVVCNKSGAKFPNGKDQFYCWALHNGKVTMVPGYRAPQQVRNSNPFMGNQIDLGAEFDSLFDRGAN